jgi:hypothetical protein
MQIEEILIKKILKINLPKEFLWDLYQQQFVQKNKGSCHNQRKMLLKVSQ